MRPAVTRRPRQISDPIIEPLWSGVRVIAHVGAPRTDGDREVLLIDDRGADRAVGEPVLASRLGAAVAADHAVIDGVISGQMLLGDRGTAVVTEAWLSSPRLLLSRDAGVDVRRRTAGEADPRGPGGREGREADAKGNGLVCLDLLSLDGEPLLDVPLLERKRLLESVVRGSEHILVSAHTRPPADRWIATWKSLGLRGGMLKAANSRYLPGDWTLEWRPLERIAARR